MLGRDLLSLLLIHHRMKPNQLATALKGAVGQPQIHKFLKGEAKEPRRSTLEPIALFFDVPLDAFYDSHLAWKVAITKGLLPILSPSLAMPPPPKQIEEARPASAPPIYIQPATPPLRDALKALRAALANEPQGVRKSVVAIFGDLAERADDEQFGNLMIDRIMGALGHPEGKPVQPESTPSSSHSGRG